MVPSSTLGGCARARAAGSTTAAVHPEQAAFEEGVGVRVEEPAPARREFERAVLHPEENRAKEGEQLSVHAEAMVHALGVRPGIVAETPVQAVEAQVFGVARVLDGQQTLILGVEEEHQPQDDAEHTLIEVVPRLLERGAKPIDAVDGDVSPRRGLEAGDEDLDRLEDLLGQRFGDVGLAASALGKEPPVLPPA